MNLARTLCLAILAWMGSAPAFAQFVRIDSFQVVATNSAGSVLFGQKRAGNTNLGASQWSGGILRPLQGLPEGVRTTFNTRGVSGTADVIVGHASSSPLVVASLIGGVYTVISPPGPDQFRVWDLSTDGTTAAGSYQQQQGTNRVDQAATLDVATGTPTLLSMPAGHERSRPSQVNAASFDGSVLVGYRTVPGTDRALRWTDGVVAEAVIPPIDGLEYPSSAVDVSADGRVVLGSTGGIRPSTGLAVEQIWLWSGSTITQLPEYPGYTPTSSSQWDPLALSGDGRTVLATCGSGRLCLWDAENGWRFLSALIDESGTSTSTFSFFATGDLSHDGQVVVGQIREANTTNFSFVFRLADDRIRVTTTGDQADSSPDDSQCDVSAEAGLQCTLRAAIQTANARPGADEILFEIPGDGPHVITVTSPLPALAGPTVFDGTTQPGYAGSPLVVVRGSGVSGDGLVLSRARSAVKGLAVVGFGGAGIRLSGPGESRVEASYVGVGADGVTALPNGVGIRVDGSPDHVIGGDEEALRNVISGNTGAGVVVAGAAATGVVVAGNRIGTAADGTAAVANGAEGVRVDGAPGVRIGGPTEAERNLIAGNATHGVLVTGATADGVQVVGNWIGLAADGTTPLANGTDTASRTGHHGVVVVSAPNVVVGGATGTPGTGPGNVIAASAAHGVYVTGTPAAPSSGVQVLGNLVGTDRTGGVAVVGGAEAVYVSGAAAGARIGQAGAGNVVVGGASDDAVKGGIWLVDLGTAGGAPDGATVAANTVGLNAAGSAVLGSMGTAVAVVPDAAGAGVAGVTIGGPAAADGNRLRGALGVAVIGPRAAGTAVVGNTVGLLASGELARPERDPTGILVAGAREAQVVSNTVGGFVVGVVVAADAVALLGNRIGTNPGGTLARPNTVGVYIPGQLTDGPAVGDSVRVGAAGAGNVISGNERTGLLVGGTYTLSATTALDLAAPRLAAPDLASPARRGDGAPDGVEIAFNRIGTSASGQQAVGNGRAATDADRFPGVWIRDGRGARIVGNVVSANGNGIVVFAGEDGSGSPGGVFVGGTVVGASADLSRDLPNQAGGVLLVGSPDNRLGAVALAPGGEPVGNVVVGNGQGGVIVRPLGGETGNQVRATSFLRNQGPSLLVRDGDLGYPPFAATPPVVLSAVRTDAGVVVRGTAATAGGADVFVAPNCPSGRAQGSVRGAATLAAGPFELPLPASAAALNSYVALTVTPDAASGTTSELSACVRVGRAEDVVEVPVAPDETGTVVDGVQIEVTVTDHPSAKAAGGGRLAVTRFGEQTVPEGGAFAGSATSPDGTTVTPNAVSSNRHWTIRAEGLDNLTYDVCLDADGVGGVVVPGQLVVVHRASAGEAWTPYASTLSGTRLCAAGLTAWGDLGLGADSTVNPVPTPEAPAAPEVFALAAAPNPSPGTVTLTVAVPEAAPVRVEAFDALGRRVAVVHDGPLGAGLHGLRLAGLPAGVYVVRASAGAAVAVQRLTVVR